MKKIPTFVYIVILILVFYNIYLVKINSNLQKEYSEKLSISQNVMDENSKDKSNINLVKLYDLDEINNLNRIYISNSQISLDFKIEDIKNIKDLAENIKKTINANTYSIKIQESNYDDFKSKFTIILYGESNE